MGLAATLDLKEVPMLERKLVDLIQERADELAEMGVQQIREDPRTSGYRDLDEETLFTRTHRVYANLGRWLRESSESAVEEEYVALGNTRREEGIPLSQVVMALLLVRRNLWSYVNRRNADSYLELRQQLDLELVVVRFFDRAIFHTVRGYESG